MDIAPPGADPTITVWQMGRRANPEVNEAAERALEAGVPEGEVFEQLTAAYGSEDAAYLVLDLLLTDLQTRIGRVNWASRASPADVSPSADWPPPKEEDEGPPSPATRDWDTPHFVLIDDIVHSRAVSRLVRAGTYGELWMAVELAREWRAYFGEPPELVEELEREIEWAEERVREIESKRRRGLL